jgi:hypothetical protein
VSKILKGNVYINYIMTEGVKTRSGRISKAPKRLEVFEEVEDDYREDEYDSDVDLLQSDDEDFCSGDEEEGEDEHYSDSDEDEQGNLKGFVVDDTDEDEDYSEEDEDEE